MSKRSKFGNELSSTIYLGEFVLERDMAKHCVWLLIRMLQLVHMYGSAYVVILEGSNMGCAKQSALNLSWLCLLKTAKRSAWRP